MKKNVTFTKLLIIVFEDTFQNRNTRCLFRANYHVNHSLRASSLGGGGREGEKRRELAMMSQEFSFLRRKSRHKMLIGGY